MGASRPFVGIGTPKIRARLQDAAQLPATGQWLRKLASTVNEELRYRANRAISNGHDPNR